SRLSKSHTHAAERTSRRKSRRIDVYTTEQFTGPLPHPAILEKYEHTLPGSADRILGMAEKQATHRRELELKVVRSNIRNEVAGILVTFAITMTSIGGSIWLIAHDKQVAGFLTMISTLLTLVYNFYSKNKTEKESIEKLKKLDTAKSSA
ncbi:DUF2335 domain-containing protein, partial [Candidatus Microgenomates bacterium]|nr:DUF2335 domain-containing protein [Candidatus Microgenomates bacterium]